MRQTFSSRPIFALFALVFLTLSASLYADVADDGKGDRPCFWIVVDPATVQQTNINQGVDYDIEIRPFAFDCGLVEEAFITYSALTPGLILTELAGPNPDLTVTPTAGALRDSRFLIQAEAYDISGNFLGRSQRQVSLTVLDGVDPRPDLVTSSLTGPTSVIEGQSIRYDAIFQNVGQQSAGSTFFGRLTINGTNQGSRSCGNLAPQATCSAAWLLTAPTPGNYTVEVCADSSNQVLEADESNNCRALTLQVAATPRPDLVPEFITCPSSPEVGSPAPVVLGIRNLGNAASGSFTLEFEGIIASCPALQPGQQCQQTVTWTPTTAGQQTVVLEADPSNQITESNEANNTITKSVNVAAIQGPELYFAVDGVAISPAAPSVGDWVTVTVRMHNSGDSLSGYPYPRMDVLFNGQTTAFTCYEGIPNAGDCVRSFQVQITSSGTYTITAIADPFDEIAEIDETNNSRSLNFVVANNVTCAGTWFLSGVGHSHNTSSSGSVVDGCYVYFGQNTPSGCYTTTAAGGLSAIWFADSNGCPNYVRVTDAQGAVFEYTINIQ